MKAFLRRSYVANLLVALCFAASLRSLASLIEPAIARAILEAVNFLGRRSVAGFVPIESTFGFSGTLVAMQSAGIVLTAAVGVALLLWLFASPSSSKQSS